MTARVRYALMACLLVTPVAAAAQPTVAGAIRGTVTDEQGLAVPDAVIEAVGPPVAGRRHTMTDAAGTYRLIDLPPGEYTVTASRDGFGRTERTAVVVRAGLALTIDHVLRVGPIDVTIDAVADQPLFDTVGAVQATNISGELQERLPLSSQRDWADFLLITPGVVNNDGGLFGRFYYNHGSGFDSHVMQLDGVDLAATSQNTNVLIRLNPDALADVQVKTAGIDAASPLGTGLVISMASRSGSDVFRGIQGLFVRPRTWSANNNPGGTTSASSLLQVDLSIGGPLRRGRWWVFAAHQWFEEQQNISRTPEQLATLRALVPGFEPFSNESRAQVPFMKITGRLGDTHQIFGFHQYDRASREGARPTDGMHLGRSFSGGAVDAIGVSSTWRDLLTRVVLSYNAKQQEREVLGEGPAIVVFRSINPSLIAQFGSAPIAFLANTDSAFADDSNTWTVAGEATYYRTDWLGRHEITGGISVQRRHEDQVREHVNGGFVQEIVVLRDAFNPTAGTVPYHRLTLTPANISTVLARAHDVAVYVRDIWSVGSRLTLNLGVRADAIRRSDRLFDVRTQRSTDVGPRLGLTYALASDGRRVVRAGWGRVHDALSTNTILVGDDTAASRIEIDGNLDGVFETVFETPRITALSNRLLLDPDRSQPFVDEWTAGYGHRLPWNISADVSLIRRAYRHRTTFVETNGIYDGGRFVGYRNQEVNEIWEVTGNRWNWPVYTGLEVRVTRQSGAAQFLAGYTRGFQRIAGTWQPNDPASIIQPGAFANDKGIGSVSGGRRPATVNSLSGFSDTSAPQWRDHVLRTALTVQAPWGVQLATTYSFQSGAWSGPVVTRRAAPDPRFGSETITLANGRLVQNPLATPIRFAFPTRGDGQFALPGVHVWNVRVGRSTTLPWPRARLDVALELFNVLNLGRDQFVLFGGNQLDSPDYGKGASRQLPRSAAVSARVAF